jgi:hypothetical protein
VTFNFTIMGQADQGFFDVAVNFDAIFCSAKVDCTYDDAGNDPIELLHDPATGERTQTAVIGIACSAGPGNDVDTAILLNDIRLYCGDVAVPMFSASDIATCEDDGEGFYGLLQTFAPTGVRFLPVVWRRNDAGAYVPENVTVTDPDGLAAAAGMSGSPPFDDGIPFTVLADDSETHALGLLGKFASMVGGDWMTSFSDMRVSVMKKSSTTPNAWEVTQVLAYPDGFDPARRIAVPQESDTNDYIVVTNGFDLYSTDNGEGVKVAIYPRTQTTSWAFGAPILLQRDTSVHAVCEDLHPGLDTLVLACENASESGRWDLLVYDVGSTPSGTVPNGLFLDPSVIPLRASDFNFDGGLTATSLQRISAVGAFGADQNAQVFARVDIGVPGIPTTQSRSQLVHFTRSGTNWVPAAPILGRANLARDPLPHAFPNNADSWTYVSFVYELGGGDAVIGGDMPMLEGPPGAEYATNRAFVGYFRNNTWLGPWTFDYNWRNIRGALVAPNGDLYAYGDRLAGSWPGGTREAFFVRLDPSAPGPVTPADISTLPRPVGWVAHFNDAIVGARGSNLPSDNRRRLAGAVLEPDGAGGFHRHGIEWSLAWDNVLQLFTLASWVVFEPTAPYGPLADPGADGPDADWSASMDDRVRRGNLAAPRFSSGQMRCQQTVDFIDLGDEQGAPYILDPNLDTPVGGVLGGHVPAPDGLLFTRDAVVDANTLLPEPDVGDSALLDPTHTAEGNVWTSANPKPSDIPAHVLQMASYHGEESLLCDGQSCNKLYWNTAIAFDPTVPNCRLAFEAVAARVSSLVDGQLPPNTMWPIIVGRVPLTTNPAEEGVPAELACTRHPLGSPEVFTVYEPQDFDWQTCYGFGASGSPPAMSGGGDCPVELADYLRLEMQMSGGGGDDGP